MLRRCSIFAATLAALSFAGLGAGCAKGVSVGSGAGGQGGDDTGAGGSGGGAVDAGTDAPPGPCVKAEDCAALDDACNVGTCINGTCEKTAANDGSSCDDGLYCTDGDACQGGVCIGGSARYCPSADPCHVGVCDEATKSCDQQPGNDGASCDDDDMCTYAGTCVGGACQKGPAVDCSALDTPCAVGACDPQQGCVPIPKNEGAACDDGLFCTVGDTCQSGACQGSPNTCAAPGDACLVGVCDEATDSCVAQPGNDGSACDDADACTTGETCGNGVCQGGAPANEGGACNDGKACTANDTCSGGTCAGTPITTCVNGDGCCPAGCSAQTDDDCTCDQNIALSATASISSGGSVPPYTPAEMNNGIGKNVCQWAWVENNAQPSGAWMQLTWPQPVTIGSFYIETESSIMPSCGNTARNIASGTVQYWDGAQWVTSTSFSGKHDDVQIDLPSPVVTTKLRVYDVTTDPGNGNSIIYEWHVYQGPGCVPPP